MTKGYPDREIARDTCQPEKGGCISRCSQSDTNSALENEGLDGRQWREMIKTNPSSRERLCEKFAICNYA